MAGGGLGLGEGPRRDRSVAAVEEVAAVARTSPTLLRERVEMLTSYADEHPVLHRALLDGQISTERARLIARETLRLPGARERAWVQTAIVPVAERLGEAGLRRRVEVLIAQADPQRYRDLLDDAAAAKDTVHVRHRGYGQVALTYHGSLDSVASLHAALTHRAAAAVLFDLVTDPATVPPGHQDHLADTDTDPAETDPTDADAVRVRVEPKVTLNVTIPYQVLAALWAGKPAPTAFGLIDVAGHGPIPATALASLLVEHGARATWRCQILDDRPDTPTHATIIGVGRAAHHGAYTPSPSLRALVQARTPHCAFPGCRRPTQRCDLDHLTPYAAGGPTTETNLTPLCRRHHLLEHHGAFTPTLDPATGRTTWRTPSGHHITEPTSPDAWPPPF